MKSESPAGLRRNSQANTRRRELLVWFEAVLPQMIEALERGESLIEVS